MRHNLLDFLQLLLPGRLLLSFVEVFQHGGVSRLFGLPCLPTLGIILAPWKNFMFYVLALNRNGVGT